MHPSKHELYDYEFNPLSGCEADCPFCNELTRAEQFGGDIRLNKADRQYWVPGQEGRLFILEKPFATPDGRNLVHPFGFAPTFHRYRLGLPAKTNSGHTFGVCTVGDLFGPWVPTRWIMEVMDACLAAPQHNYVFKTHYPEWLVALDKLALLPGGDRFWYGTTITAPGEPAPVLPGHCTFLNIDPLRAPLEDFAPCVDMVVIGTGAAKGKRRYHPEREWVEEIATACKRKGVPVFMRNSLRELMGADFLRELPAALMDKPLSPLRREQLYGRCGFCKEERKKSDMTAIIFRKGRRGPATTDAYACDTCLGHLKGVLNGPLPVGGIAMNVKGGAEQ